MSWKFSVVLALYKWGGSKLLSKNFSLIKFISKVFYFTVETLHCVTHAEISTASFTSGSLHPSDFETDEI